MVLENQTVIVQLEWISECLSDFYEPDEIRMWLQLLHPQLAGQCPYNLIVKGRISEVLEVIDRLDSGVYL